MHPVRPHHDHADPGRNLRDAMTAAEQAELRFRAFVHELAGLVDGSLRSVQLARRRVTGSDSAMPHDARVAMSAAEQGLSSIAELIHEVRERGGDTGAGFCPRPTPMRVVDAIEDAVELVRPAASEKGVTIVSELDRGVFAVPSLPIFPVVQNGLRNAVEACGPSSVVRVVAQHRNEPDRLVIRVIDDGPGLPEEPGHSPFERGYTTKPGGMGLGLALGEEIVQWLGGSVSLRNRDDAEHGCVFTVTIPLSETGSGAAA